MDICTHPATQYHRRLIPQVCPTTIDMSLASGDEIPIEQRSAEEVTYIQGVCITPEDCEAANPAFDITPHRYITAIITERGIIKEPYGEGLRKIVFRNLSP